MIQTDVVYLKKRGRIAEFIMNRPEMLNAGNWAMIKGYHSVLDELEADRDIRAVVVSGVGRSFSTGIDLKALSSGEIDIHWFRRFDEATRRLEMLAPLTVAKVHGYAIGGGLQLALACDLRVVAPDSKFGLPAVLEALIPGMGTYRLPRFIGLGRARRMVLTGELIGAEEAERIGLVDWVVPAESLDDKVDSVIAEITKGSSAAQALSMKLVNSPFPSFEDAFATYLDYQAQCIQSDEHKIMMADYRNRKKK